MNSQFDNQVGGTHYNKLKIQPTQYVLANDMKFCEGNVIKNGAEDLKKCVHYIQFLLESKYDVKSKIEYET